ncbi:hypothetical protein HY633_00695 [Candidatus Uhrbacteria bacterium]|nr:hypothetical protein [Candidatus Uhrbacteria bacterium]
MSRTPVFLTPVMVGAAFLAAAKLAPRIGDAFWPTLGVVIAVLLIALAGMLGFAVRMLDREIMLRSLGAPLFLVLGAYGFLLLVETTRGRYALTAGVMAALALYAEQLRIAQRLRRHSDFLAVEHLAHPLRLLGLFFLLDFLFGVNAFVPVPVAARAALAGLAAGLAATPVFGNVIGRKQAAATAAVFGLVVAELFSAFALLPVSALASAAALTLLFSGVLHLVRHPFTPEETPRQARRSFASAVLMTAAVLATARWI